MPLDTEGSTGYNGAMIIQHILLSNESYTHGNWEYRNVCVGYSRLYYILDGEAYYEEEGMRVRLKPKHLYLTPVRHPFSLTENAENKLLHTYAHVITQPAVTCFTEFDVQDGTPLGDAVTLWRKYVHTESEELLRHILEFLLSCLSLSESVAADSLPQQAKAYLDKHESTLCSMESLCKALGYSREHITRAFRACYHITPMQYMQKRLMSHALRCLHAGERVAAVAADLGYASAYSFSKAFKKHFGLSPQKYFQALYAE